jgi:hypothetical protein
MPDADWVAGTVRARALARRRVGRGRARELAGLPPRAAVRALAQSTYGRYVLTDHSPTQAEYAVGEALLWNLRVLAGWLPGRGVQRLRLLAGWFEVANVDEHVRRLAGRPAAPAYHLGALSTAWPSLARAATLPELRRSLAASAWGDPGAATPRAVALGMRASWAARVAAAVPAARSWATGALALLTARETVLSGHGLDGPAARTAARLLGADALAARSVSHLAERLPGAGRWILADVRDAAGLWRAEARWWRRLDDDGFALLRRPQLSFDPVLGAVAVLAADAWRVRAALACASGHGRTEAFDAVA